MAELSEGTVFAGHRIDGVAGRGGMGVVYRATHLALDHVVALKVISPELAHDERFRERFVRESRVAVSIRHANVVQVRHAGEEDGVLFVTMDYIDGSDLRTVITTERRIEPARAAWIIGQVAAALDASHERGLVHRDVKPGNVLIEGGGADERVYLTDFGLTKRMSGATELTASGAFIGTLEYMAPEQIRGGELDARTDVYALGGVAFATITGEAPFGRVDGDVAKLYAHLNDPVPRASERVPGLPPALDPVFQRAMAKDPGERYASAGELARALERAAGDAEPESTVAAPVVVDEPTEEVTEPEATAPLATPPEPATAGQGRRRALGALAGLAVVGAVVGAIALIGGGDGGNGDGGGEPTGQGQRTASPGAPRELAQVPAGEYPIGAVLDGDRLLVASRDDGTLLEFNARNIEATPAEATIPGGETDFIARGDGVLYTADAAADRLYELDPKTLEPGAFHETGGYPRDIFVTPSVVWVANRESDTFTRLDLLTGLTGEVPADPSPGVGDYPRRLVGDEGRMWASFRDSGLVQAFDSADGTPVTAPIDLGGEPHGMATEGGFLWIANTALNSLQRLPLSDPEAPGVLEEFPVCESPRDVRVVFDAVWVSCGGSDGAGQLVKLNTSGKELATLTFDVTVENIAASERLGRIWLTGGESGQLIEIDPGD